MSLFALPLLQLPLHRLAFANNPSRHRLFQCMQFLEGNRALLAALGSGLWPVMVLVSEVVQTFILADFW